VTLYRCCWPGCGIPLVHTPLACPAHLEQLSTPARDKLEAWAAGTIALTEDEMYQPVLFDWRTNR
jgi:hypothetical protein